MMKSEKTSLFIELITRRINEIVPCYYEEAESAAVLPYAVITDMHTTDLGAVELAEFDVHVWAEEKAARNPAEDLEKICDELAAGINKTVLRKDGVIYSHIYFDDKNPLPEAEADLLHRQLSFMARNIYTGG